MNKKKLGLLSFLIGSLSILMFLFNINTVKASSINDYIINNKIQPSSITYRNGTFNVWEGYENGVGKPEGVVIHDTAVDGDSAAIEEQSFNSFWETYQAYAHAFVDDSNIIQIHNTDYMVWAAGPTANYKFIQVELCHETTTDGFARSVANQAYYAASKLIQYHLPDIPGVTVLSHHQTSLKWHETSHIDPDEYFVRFGYSMDQMNALISYYYNNLKNSNSVYGNNADTNGGTTSDTNNTGISNSGVIKVNNANGSYVQLVAFNDDGSVKTVTNRGLANNTPWYTDQTRDYNGITYRRVATNEWVASQYIIG